MRVVHTPSLGLALGLAFLALLTTSLASAAPGDASRRYVFLGNDNLPPLIYKDNDRVEGVVIEIVREVAAKANLDVDIRWRILGRWRDQDDVVWIFGREVFWYRVSIVLALLAVGLSVVIYVENRKIRRARRVLAEEARRRLERLLTPVLLGSSR